jgi:hypothetical protein
MTAAPGLSRHATKNEIVELAAAEGHDADIPTNAGSIRQAVSRTSTRLRTSTVDEKNVSEAMEKDVEKIGDSASIASTAEPEDAVPDPNVVDFDGPNDLENPLNWKASKKWGMVALVSAITFLTPLASSIFAPGVPEVMREFNSTSDMLEGFMISVYVLGVSLYRERYRHVVLTPA